MKNQTSIRTSGIGFLSLLALCILGTPASAQVFDPSDESVPRVIPFHGRLEADGVAVTGEVDLEFSIAYADGTWAEAHSGDDAVIVDNGSFTVLLGSITSIPDVFFAAEEVELVIARQVTECDDVGCISTQHTLTPTQLIVPTAHALWTARGLDFEAANQVVVEGDLLAETGIDVAADVHFVRADGAGGTVNSASATVTTLTGTTVVEVAGDLNVPTLTTTGEINVDGDEIRWSGSDRFAFQYDSGDVLDIIQDVTSGVFGSGMDFVGTITFSANVTLDGRETSRQFYGSGATRGYDSSTGTVNWNVNSGRDLIRIEHLSVDGDGVTNISDVQPRHYVCFIGGVWYRNGDICEGSNSECITCDSWDRCDGPCGCPSGATCSGDDGTCDSNWSGRCQISGQNVIDPPWWDPDYPVLECNSSGAADDEGWERGIATAYLEPGAGTANRNYTAFVDFLTHSDDEDEAELLVVCVQESVTRITCPDTGNYWTSGDCNSDGGQFNAWLGDILAKPESWPPNP